MQVDLIVQLFSSSRRKYSVVRAWPRSFFFYVIPLSLLFRKLQWAALRYSSAFLVRANLATAYTRLCGFLRGRAGREGEGRSHRLRVCPFTRWWTYRGRRGLPAWEEIYCELSLKNLFLGFADHLCQARFLYEGECTDALTRSLSSPPYFLPVISYIMIADI